MTSLLRGFKGPVPPPLWIRIVSLYEIVYYTLPCYFLKVNYNFENILFLGKIQIIQGGGLSCQTYCQWGQKGFKIFIQKMCAYFLDSRIFENMHTLSGIFLEPNI